MTCRYCGSSRGVKEWPSSSSYGELIRLCQVCSRLHGVEQSATLNDINRNIVTLFHTLGLIPHDTDEEEE